MTVRDLSLSLKLTRWLQILEELDDMRICSESNWEGICLPEETFLGIMKFLAEPRTYPNENTDPKPRTRIPRLEEREMVILC